MGKYVRREGGGWGSREVERKEGRWVGTRTVGRQVSQYRS